MLPIKSHLEVYPYASQWVSLKMSMSSTFPFHWRFTSDNDKNLAELGYTPFSDTAVLLVRAISHCIPAMIYHHYANPAVSLAMLQTKHLGK